jgi:hypothetical protein
VSTFSGDGSPGGDLRVRFDVLPGDLNGSGQTTLADVYFGRPSQFTDVGHAAYDALHDVDGNGLLNVVDLTLVRNFQGRSLPAGTPAGSPAAAAAAVVVAARSPQPTNPLLATTSRRAARAIARPDIAEATDAALSAIGEDVQLSRTTLRRLRAMR